MVYIQVAQLNYNTTLLRRTSVGLLAYSYRGNIAYNFKAVALRRAVALKQAVAFNLAIAFRSRLFKDIQPSKL